MQMSVVRTFVFLLAITSLNYGQEEHSGVALSSQAEIPVRGLYQQLASQPIGGIPTPDRMKVISPYLSSSLLSRIAQTRACGDDWIRLHPRKDVKPPFAWGEFGLFSGPNDRSGPRTFQIEKAEPEKDGSVRVYVRLTEGTPPEKPWTWEVEVIVIRENRHFAISDVIFLKDKDVDTESRLSDVLTSGCDGTHWIGYPN
jgi:hypothetical protein